MENARRTGAGLIPTIPLVGLTRKTYKNALALGAAILFAASGPARAADTDWPTFQFDSGHTGFNKEGRMPDNLIPEWNVSLGAGGWGFASPVQSENLVYSGSIQGEIRAVARKTGETAWSFRGEGSIYLAPAVAEGTLYFGSTAGRLTALDAATGEVKWSFDTGSNINAAPNVVDATVYFASNSGAVYALNAHTGELIWRVEHNAYFLSSPAADDDRIYIGTHDGRFLALNRSDGSTAWQADLPYDGVRLRLIGVVEFCGGWAAVLGLLLLGLLNDGVRLRLIGVLELMGMVENFVDRGKGTSEVGSDLGGGEAVFDSQADEKSPRGRYKALSTGAAHRTFGEPLPAFDGSAKIVKGFGFFGIEDAMRKFIGAVIRSGLGLYGIIFMGAGVLLGRDEVSVEFAGSYRVLMKHGKRKALIDQRAFGFAEVVGMAGPAPVRGILDQAGFNGV